MACSSWSPPGMLRGWGIAGKLKENFERQAVGGAHSRTNGAPGAGDDSVHDKQPNIEFVTAGTGA